MKAGFLALMMLVGTVAQAGQYDGMQIQCSKGSFEVQLTGKKGWFSSPAISLKKNGELLVNEDAEEVSWQYNERQGNPTPAELKDLLRYGSKVKPRSISYDSDINYVSSENTLLLETYDTLQPAFGGETRSLILQIKPTSEFVTFELDKDCRRVQL